MAGTIESNEGPMRALKTREEDATFELNLAPMLDIIVSIIPMLLLSVVFVQITVIDTPIPQAVEKAVAAANEKNKDLVIDKNIYVKHCICLRNTSSMRITRK